MNRPVKMKAKILIVDDVPEQVSALGQILEQNGYTAVIGENDLEAFYLLDTFQPDLIILDIGFGDNERMGIDILKKIRTNDKTIPIIMLTGLDDDGLDSLSYNRDADYFVSKSVSPESLLALVNRCLRRSKPEIEVFDDYLMINRSSMSVKKKQNREGEEVSLEPMEYKILMELIDNCGWVVTREVLESFFPDSKNPAATLNRYISELRKKLEPDPGNPRYIFTRRGNGYSFDVCE